MFDIGFAELLLLAVISLLVLGPERLPKVANKIGNWVGQARRMTRMMRRQLEDELNFDEDLNVKPRIEPPAYTPPRDDDDYSPLHAEETETEEKPDDEAKPA